jgi:succinoglycan biosynthesis protein ExoO
VRVLVNESNRGVSHSRNRAIREARGEWLALLDADDWFAPGRLAILIDNAHRANAHMVVDDMFLVNDGTGLAYSTWLTDIDALHSDNTWIAPAQFVRLDLGSLKPLMRRQFIVGNALFFPEDVRYGEDFLQLLHALLAGGRLLLVPTPMYHLRRGDTGSATTNRLALTTQITSLTQQMLSDPMIASDKVLCSALQQRLSFVTDLMLLSEFTTEVGARNIGAALFRPLRQPRLLVALARRSLAFVATRIRRRRQQMLLNTATRLPLTGCIASRSHT